MAETHVISALVHKRAQIAGDIENAQEAMKRLVAELEHVDATIRLFDPDYRIEGIKPTAFRPPDDWSKRGEMTRVILDLMRQAKEPLTPRDLAASLMKLRGLDCGDRKLLVKMTKRVGAALRHARDRKLAKASQAAGMFMVWEITR